MYAPNRFFTNGPRKMLIFELERQFFWAGFSGKIWVQIHWNPQDGPRRFKLFLQLKIDIKMSSPGRRKWPFYLDRMTVFENFQFIKIIYIIYSFFPFCANGPRRIAVFGFQCSIRKQIWHEFWSEIGFIFRVKFAFEGSFFM